MTLDDKDMTIMWIIDQMVYYGFIDAETAEKGKRNYWKKRVHEEELQKDLPDAA